MGRRGPGGTFACHSPPHETDEGVDNVVGRTLWSAADAHVGLLLVFVNA